MEPVETIVQKDIQQWVAQEFSKALLSGLYFKTDTSTVQDLG